MHRFFIPPGNITPTSVSFPMEISRQISTVLRLRAGQRVIALDNAGREYEVELESVSASSTQGRILSSREAGSEPRLYLSLYLGLTQREKFEWMLQKCTEVGAAEFIPVATSRGLVQSLEESQARQERWRRILQEAAEQSGRGRIPLLASAVRWDEALRQFQARAMPGLIAWEGEQNQTLAAAMAQTGLSSKSDPRLALVIGPEGGFSPAEIDQARAAGLVPVSLGRRILRMETAAVVAAALIFHDLGDL